MMRIALQKLNRRDITHIVIFTILGVLIIALAYMYLPVGVDYHGTFRPAPLALLRGESPYNGYGFFYPPWTLLPLIPIAILPEKLGNAIFFLSCLMAFVLMLYKFRANLATSLVFLLSPPVLIELWSLNINWLTMLGYLMPPQVGLFFVLMKPQVGGVMALYWLVEAWRNGGIRQVIKTFWPVTVALLLSQIVYPGWYMQAFVTIHYPANISFWPLSIPIGIVLAILALRLRKERYAYMASPFLSPYVAPNSFSTVLLGLVNSPWELIAAVVGFWIAIFVSRAVF